MAAVNHSHSPVPPRPLSEKLHARAFSTAFSELTSDSDIASRDPR